MCKLEYYSLDIKLYFQSKCCFCDADVDNVVYVLTDAQNVTYLHAGGAVCLSAFERSVIF